MVKLLASESESGDNVKSSKVTSEQKRKVIWETMNLSVTIGCQRPVSERHHLSAYSAYSTGKRISAFLRKLLTLEGAV